MDGVGIGENDAFSNAVYKAYTPTLDSLFRSCPFTSLKAHGKAVGLPSDDDMGNSEVGHNTIGCGDIYSQGASLVNESISSGDMFRSPSWKRLIKNCLDRNSVLHFLGLLSDGNVHSNINHLTAMVKQAKSEGIAKVRIHILLDGRDVPSDSALIYVDMLEKFLGGLKDSSFNAAIASGGGRMKITMDRYEADWDMVRLGWKTHVLGEGECFPSAACAIAEFRSRTPGIIDQDLPPFVVADENNNPIGKISNGDSVILFNFRGDRAIEISSAFDNPLFDKFERQYMPDLLFAGMLQYDGDLKIPRNFLVAPPQIQNTLSEILVDNNITQYAVSETQKFGHVTYFWNGNKSGKFSEKLETYYEIPSDDVPFNQRPWMKAAEITDSLISVMKSQSFDFIRCNFPNGDMVGHTGDFHAVVVAVEAVDLCLKRLLAAADKYNYSVIITADHGNADVMFDKQKDGSLKIRTAHSLSPVPFFLYDKRFNFSLRQGNELGLSNIAATVAQLLGVEPHPNWSESLILK